uniref:Uncharacterized protein n=1 Tax=Rhizophora mucronata TaxID=61149 RepID=A0A2P2Q109_RHIMU
MQQLLYLPSQFVSTSVHGNS